MRRRAIALALAGAGLSAARALAPRLHARLLAGCERMFEQAPDGFPPKRMLRGIEEIRTNSARTLALLEARERAQEAEGARPTAPGSVESVPLGGNAEEELAVVGAGAPRSDAQGRRDP